MLLKEVKPGENIYSVMNILDAIRVRTFLNKIFLFFENFLHNESFLRRVPV